MGVQGGEEWGMLLRPNYHISNRRGLREGQERRVSSRTLSKWGGRVGADWSFT
jgi:hypothetical protein